MGPLEGYKVVELAGIGPGPFCCMLLADAGAEVIRVDRTQDAGLGVKTPPEYNLLNRGRKSVAVDLKSPEGVATVLRLVEQADALVEGFRPGVTERMGLGPEDCWSVNPKLVYGRMTGWGQDGPLAHAAGHDMNYIALTGALHAIGRKDGPPVPPLNLVGDFGGGALYLAFGICAALLEAQKSGKGQVVDAAMVDGAANLMTIFYGLKAMGMWRDERGVNILDSGAHYYEAYETKDGKYVSIASIEKKFYQELLEKTGLDKEDLPAQNDAGAWSDMKDRLAEIFRTKTRDEWCEIMEGSDVCFAPVLSLSEAPSHEHIAARETFTDVAGVTQPNAAPRFGRSGQGIQRAPAAPGEHTAEVLKAWGFGADEIEKLKTDGVIAQTEPERREAGE